MKYMVKSMSDIDSNKFHAQLAPISHYDKNSLGYKVVLKDSSMCKGIRKKEPVYKFMVWEFNTETERDNFIHYMMTDFTRFLLAIYKNNNHNDSGELDLVPMLNFKESWDDEKLYKHFNISKETQEYIRNFLPDYYNLRSE